MTFSVGHVEGGTNAGHRRVKTRESWACGCAPLPDPLVRYVPRTHPGSVYSCQDCGQRRDRPVVPIGLEREGWDTPPVAA